MAQIVPRRKNNGPGCAQEIMNCPSCAQEKIKWPKLCLGEKAMTQVGPRRRENGPGYARSRETGRD